MTIDQSQESQISHHLSCLRSSSFTTTTPHSDQLILISTPTSTPTPNSSNSKLLPLLNLQKTIPFSSSSTASSHSSSSSSPSSPAQSVSSYASSVHSSNLALIHPSNSLASLSISSPSNLRQQQQQQQPTHPILSHSPILPNNSLTTTLLQQSDPSLSINPTPPSHLHNRSIPPPLTLLPTSAQSSSNHSDDLMTARCSQFPIDTLEPRHSTLGSCRFQPYLSPLPTDTSAWSSELKSQPNPPRSLFHPSQLSPSQLTSSLDDSPLSSNDLHSSCSSLASSTKSSQSSSYFPSTNPTNLPFQDPSSTSSVRNAGDVLFPPLAPPGFSQAAAYPAYNGPTSRTSLGLVYPATAFTPSGGSPPIASASSAYFHFDSAGAGRRHTVSAYASPMPIELSMVSNPEFDEHLIKDEKRRRNKESSQRFRDRTRERQREKQERLEYLERRTKELENQLKTMSRGERSDMRNEVQPQDPSAHNAGREMNEKLWAENESLRSMLKKAGEEINRLQKLVENQTSHSPLSVGQLYTTLSQLSPAPTVDHTPGSQPSSPAAEQSYFMIMPRGTSPTTDKPNSSQSLAHANFMNTC